MSQFLIKTNSSGGGNVSGPASSTDGDIVLFSGNSGQIIKDSNVNATGIITINGQTVPLGGTVSPNQSLQIVDDFIATGLNSGQGYLDWSSLGVGPNSIDSTSTHFGLIQFQSGVSYAGLVLSNSSPNSNLFLGAASITINFVLSLQTLSVAGNYTAYVGIGSNPINNPPTDGVFFKYSDNVSSGKWVGTCEASSVSSSQVSPVATATTGFVNLGIVINAAASSVSFFVNGVSNGDAVTTHIPTAGLNPFILFKSVSNNSPAAILDLFYMNINYVTPR